MEIRPLTLRLEQPVFERFQSLVAKLDVSQAEAFRRLIYGEIEGTPSATKATFPPEIEGQIRELKKVFEAERIGHVELMESLTSLAKFTGSLQHEGRQFTEVTTQALNRMQEAVKASLQRMDAVVKIMGETVETVTKAKRTFEDIQRSAVQSAKAVEVASNDLSSSVNHVKASAQKLTQSIETGVKRVTDATDEYNREVKQRVENYRDELTSSARDFTKEMQQQMRNVLITWGAGAIGVVLVSTVIVSSFNYFDQRDTIQELQKERKFLKDFYYYGLQEGCNNRRVVIPNDVCKSSDMKGRTNLQTPFSKEN